MQNKSYLVRLLDAASFFAGWLLMAGLLMSGLFAGATVACGQERYSLEIPGQPGSRSIVLRDARGLEIVDAQGEQHRYESRAEHDTPDGRYLGYYSATAKRFLRWPVEGQGKMQLGVRAGDAIQWSVSRMEVRRLAGGRGGDGAAVRDGAVMRDDPAAPPPLGEGGPLALWTSPEGTDVVGRLDGGGRLELYRSREGDWLPWGAAPEDAMTPGGAIAMLAEPGSLRPSVWTVGLRGDLRVWEGGRKWGVVNGPPGADLLPGSPLAVVSPSSLAVVDAQGRLWVANLERFDWRAYEEREGVLPPGAPVSLLTTPRARLLAVDRRGNLLEYRLTEKPGRAPRRWGAGFPPGAPVAVWEGDVGVAREWRAALVHNSGHVQHWFGAEDDPGERRVLRDVRLPPGSSLAIARRGERMFYTGVSATGDWLAWNVDGQNAVQDVIMAGFPGGGPVLTPGDGRFLLAVDRGGRLVASRRVRNAWESALLGRQFALAPRLVRRAVTAEPPLPPAQVLFQNTHTEELVVRLFDRASPAAPQEIVVPAGKSARVRLERDSETVLEEVFFVPTPDGGVREEVRTVRIPPTSRYTANVWVNRVTSVYFDRTTNKGPDPDEVNQSLVSLGVFPLPPGELLRDGDRVNVYREATVRKNPGAVRMLEPDPAP